MSLHLKRATKLAMIKGIVDESFIITEQREEEKTTEAQTIGENLGTRP
jgi:hypothetical protein